jgi:lipopolysaccharide/colanic/teichoic acid biosynthesis glycosyltransferase
MNISKEKKITLIHSITWAVLMLTLAFLIKGNEQANTIFIFMVGGWCISHFSIIKQVKAKMPNDDGTKTSKICCL